MNLTNDADEEAFRQEIRAFIAANLPEDIRARTKAGLRTSKDDSQRWHKILAAKGWIAPAWPKEAGGCAWEPARTYIFEEEMAMAGCPPLSPFPIKMVGPVIYTFGTDAQ